MLSITSENSPAGTVIPNKPGRVVWPQLVDRVELRRKGTKPWMTQPGHDGGPTGGPEWAIADIARLRTTAPHRLATSASVLGILGANRKPKTLVPLPVIHVMVSDDQSKHRYPYSLQYFFELD